jgi:hypothetical protein
MLRTLLPATVAALALAPAAYADSVVYQDAGNVFIENLDGSDKRQITTDGTSSAPYNFPSANDAGDVAAIKSRTGLYFIPNGQPPVVNVLPTWGSGVVTNLGGRLQPAGKLFYYRFLKNDLWSQTVAGNVVTADAPGVPNAGFPAMADATWHGENLVWSDGDRIYYGKGAETTSWLGSETASYTAAEVSRDGSRVLVKISGLGLAYQGLKGAMPGELDDAAGGCVVPGTATANRMALSPDGRWVAWHTSEGAFTAQIAIGAGDDCVLSSRRRLGENGDFPTFSAYSKPVPPPPPAPPVETGPGPTTPKPTTAPAIAIAKRPLKQALAKGLRVTLSDFPARKVTVKATRKGKTVATGTAAGKTVTLRFTKAAKKALKKVKKVQLKIVAGSVSTTITLKR